MKQGRETRCMQLHGKMVILKISHLHKTHSTCSCLSSPHASSPVRHVSTIQSIFLCKFLWIQFKFTTTQRPSVIMKLIRNWIITKFLQWGELKCIQPGEQIVYIRMQKWKNIQHQYQQDENLFDNMTFGVGDVCHEDVKHIWCCRSL